MRRMRFSILMVATALAGPIGLACVDANGAAGQEWARATLGQQVGTMKIRIDVEGTRITAALDDNETSRDFVSLLPLTLTLEDYSATEKISDLPKRLSTKGTPAGVDPSIGDIAYYAPWGNLAVFYKDAGYARGLVKIGTLDSGVEAFRVPGSLKVTIDRVD